MPWRELPPTAGLEPRLSDLFGRRDAERFEPALAAFLNVPEVQVESSGSACLVLALTYLKSVGGGRDVVIVPAYTCPLVVIAAHQAGCRVIACDLEPDGFDLDLRHLARLIGLDTLAVMPTHYGGALTDVARVRDMAKALSPDIFIVEDAAQAFGASWNGASVGTVGDIGVFSFAAGKGLTLYEGGCLVARDTGMRAGLRALAAQLAPPRPWLEARRALELIAYNRLYNPFGLALAYGLPRRHWLGRGEPARAIGDEYADRIVLHRVGAFRRGAGVRALSRLPDHLDAARQSQHLSARAVEASGAPFVPHRDPPGARSSALFLFVRTATPDALDRLLAKAWTTPLGITKLFLWPIGRYPALNGLIDPSGTPNADRLAATTFTITTSGFVSETDRENLLALLRD